MPEDGFEKFAQKSPAWISTTSLRPPCAAPGELPLEALLNTQGIDYHLRRSAGGKDTGGKNRDGGTLPSVWLGANLGSRNGTPVFLAVHNGGPAELAGVSPGDELVALDGLRINLAGCEARTRRYHPGDKSDVTVFRGDELITSAIEVGGGSGRHLLSAGDR